ncbi:serine protease inhibitor 42Dd [Zeugodacus cucurbitae]|uniref:serine protease inhibitor 42Dd n=1 Tax=Zeugodacus cucurbitae TaxID=28588 RepID=UPI0023D8FBF6|nr:serine protease inhibitor 42Dd [Zeugodacus cucurbitae]
MTKIVVLLLGFLLAQLSSSLDRQGRAEFALNFFKTITTYQPNENIIVSPASVQTCLAMTYVGAANQTAAEMRRVLSLERFANQEAAAADFGELIQTAVKAPQSKLEMANRIYVDRRLQIIPSYQALLSRYFQSSAVTVDFARNVEAAQSINAWVESETHGKIKNLIDPAVLTPDTAVVLTNAIYFKAEWLYPFDPSYTVPRDFNVNSAQRVKVPMMFRTDVDIRYAAVPNLDLVAAELPYQNTALRMLILLPNQLDGGVARLEQTLSVNTLQQMRGLLKATTLDLVLPKFKIEFDLSLVEPLKTMGLNLLFSDAELPNMVTGANNPLFVSEVKHKAFISVDEKGSEASGATYSQILERSGRFFQTKLTIDRPFVFLILDDNAIYFTGHVLKF